MPVYSSLANSLNTQHLSLELMIKDAGQERLHYIPAPGKWSVIDNIAHLASYQTIFLERIKTILREKDPAFGRYSADNDPMFETWRKFSLDELIKRMKAGRAE